jgi:hypothetical protein
MSMSCCLSCELKQELDLTGGMTNSVFPLVEKWLFDEGDHQEALDFVAARKNQDRYHSVMDFLFCEIFVKYRWSCSQYYEHDGKKLAEIISEQQRQEYQDVLMKAVQHAYAIFKEKRVMYWVKFRCEVFSLAA